MANGKEHLTVNSVIASSFILTFYNQMNSEAFSYISLGMLIGGLVTPDYDLEVIVTKEMIKKVPMIGKLWCAYWKPYAENFTHRGVSHDPVIGTLTRAIYGFWWILVFDNVQTDLIIYTLIGWYIQDFSHYIMDLPFYKLKKWLISL